MQNKKLRRSCSNRWFAGVCGGLGEFLNIDPFVFRVLFIGFWAPGGGLIYFVMWAFIPSDSE